MRRPKPSGKQTGTKRRGREPGPIVETPAEKAQTNFTDPELSIMKTANKGWEYCGNAQASVDGACQIILACDVTDQCNDKQQAEPMAQATRAATGRGRDRPRRGCDRRAAVDPGGLGHGLLQWAAVAAMEREGFDPYIATERQRHHAAPAASVDRGAGDRPTGARDGQGADACEAGDGVGSALYARRKTIVEPVFGQIKEARGFRRFLLRGLAKIRGEWRLVCLTHNLLKIWRYGSNFVRGSRCALIN